MAAVVVWLWRCGVVLALTLGLPLTGHPAAPTSAPHVALLTLQGPIGPASTDYINRSLNTAIDENARLAIIQIDTPGGLDAATRDIIKIILSSRIPVVSYVHPAGARAASAGTYILYASHIAAMSPSTTLGAATPVQIGGGLPDWNKSANKDPTTDKQPEPTPQPAAKTSPASSMERKILNDAIAFIRGLAKQNQRNAEWAELAVREAATLTADEALQQNVINIVAVDVASLLQQLQGRAVAVNRQQLSIDVAELAVRDYLPDWRNQLLAIITNPQIAYMLLLIGIYGLIFEGYSPGALVPGVVGLICLLLALYALQLLPVNYAGLALIVAGALLTAAEAFVPSFGVLGIGGVIALVFGSIMLIDSSAPGMAISPQLIAAIAASSGLVMLAVFMVVKKNLRLIRPAINKALEGQHATVAAIDGDAMQVKIHGELWLAHCQQPLQLGQCVEIVRQQGLSLEIKPIATDH